MMNQDETIVGLYHFFSPRFHEGLPPQYYLLHILDHRGILDRELVLRVLREKMQIEPDRDQDLVGSFESLEKLNQFAFLLCEEVGAPKISLLSISEYNLLLENSEGIEGFLHDLKTKGNLLENIDLGEKMSASKGFFSKFFR